MKCVRLSDACPPMPEAFHHKIVETVNRMEEKEMPKRRKLSAALIAALVGALAGAYYGCGAIPVEWRRAVPDGERIAALARRLEP